MSKIEETLHKWFIKSEQIAPVRVRTLSREALMGLMGQSGFTKGAEIGVDRGTFSKVMLEAMPDLQLMLVDPWRDTEMYPEKGEERFSTTKKRLKKYESRCIYDRRTSLESVRDVEDGSLDFIYIDGNHTFDFAMTDLIVWGNKVKEGGIIAGHDYYRFKRAGVIEAVDVYTKMHEVNEWFVTDYLKDRTPSFFWVKGKNRWS